MSREIIEWLRSEHFKSDLSRVTMRQAAEQIAEMLESTTFNQWGILLPGWTCEAKPNGVICGAFNGEAKEKKDVCRCCGANKPGA